MSASHVTAPAPYGPLPSKRQRLWHSHEFYGFIHFSINTFTDAEWGYGDEPPQKFAPTDFDASQIATVAAEAGMAGLILTCKHHDGFCLWPSPYTEHSVKNSPWRNGQGDVVREIADACRAVGLRFGVYLSPWDRNHAEYGRPAYLEYYRKQLHEITSQYGELFEVWFDGANGGDGYYGGERATRQIDNRTYYDWENTRAIVRRNQPNACMFSDGGPDIRWVGNERGIAHDPCWHTLSREKLYTYFTKSPQRTDVETDMVKAWGSPTEMLNKGDRHGASWIPAECDVSIRPGWFYHAHDDDKVRSPDNLLDLYFKSVGRGGSFLLNLPPDRRGRIHELDVESLKGFRRRLDEIFETNLTRQATARASNTRGDDPRFAPEHLLDGDRDTYWATNDDCLTPDIVFEFPIPVTFNVVGIREHLPLGQRIDAFAVDTDQDGIWHEVVSAEAIGNRRLLRSPTCTTSKLRLRILKSAACPALADFSLYFDPTTTGSS